MKQFVHYTHTASGLVEGLVVLQRQDGRVGFEASDAEEALLAHLNGGVVLLLTDPPELKSEGHLADIVRTRDAVWLQHLSSTVTEHVNMAVDRSRVLKANELLRRYGRPPRSAPETIFKSWFDAGRVHDDVCVWLVKECGLVGRWSRNVRGLHVTYVASSVTTIDAHLSEVAIRLNSSIRVVNSERELPVW